MIILFVFSPLKPRDCDFPPGSGESAPCRSYLCVRASSRCQGQHAQNLQQHPCGSHVQGHLIQTCQCIHSQSLIITANAVCTRTNIPPLMFLQAPNERARLYFLLAWFHAVIQERLRYAPLGWSKKYEFGESDLRSACDTIDTWLDDTAKVGDHFTNSTKSFKGVGMRMICCNINACVKDMTTMLPPHPPTHTHRVVKTLHQTRSPGRL